MMQLLTLLGCFFLVACGPASPKIHREAVMLQSPAGEALTVQAEIADSTEERQRGLMFREHLDPGTGMLFIFDSPSVLSFWMKNTLIPLDVLFFDQNGDFVSFQQMEPCTADPCKNYSSFANAVYALEVPKGFANANKVGIGWKMEAPVKK